MSILLRIGPAPFSDSRRHRRPVAMSYPAAMSNHSREPRGAYDFSSPQIRVRSANDFRQYSNQRLRLPNERPPLGPRIKQLVGAVLVLAILGGIGVAVYVGVALLIEDDESATVEVAGDAAEEESAAVEQQSATQSAAAQAAASVEEPADEEAVDAADSVETQSADATAQSQTQESASVESNQETSVTDAPSIAVSNIEPTVSDQLVTPAQLGGAEISAERVTAEPIPSGIPRALADGANYDPSEPATVFTSRWPIGATLRLVRLPGATLLSDEEQEQVVGTEALVVVRGTESSNTDLQLSPAAFDQIAVYGTERIIAVRVEVTAAPP